MRLTDDWLLTVEGLPIHCHKSWCGYAEGLLLSCATRLPLPLAGGPTWLPMAHQAVKEQVRWQQKWVVGGLGEEWSEEVARQGALQGQKGANPSGTQ